MAKLVWRVKLVAETRPGVTTETEVARIERDEDAGLAELGLRLEHEPLPPPPPLPPRHPVSSYPEPSLADLDRSDRRCPRGVSVSASDPDRGPHRAHSRPS